MPSNTVAIILDLKFGEKLRSLADRAIWVVRSPTNSPVVMEMRNADPRAELTAFEDFGEPDDEAFDEILHTVELHHGRHSQTPPFQRLEVYGHALAEAGAESLADLGFEVEAQATGSFTARRIRSPE